MPIRVLLADDQIPWDDAVLDERVKSEIVAEIGQKLRERGKDPTNAYEQDRAWFTELIEYLSVKQGFELTFEREYFGAEKRIRDGDNFDVVVIDLSWTGDHRLPRGERSNVGLKLIDEVAPHTSGVPVIAFSQNFEADPELMALVTKRNAFPLQKHYSHVDYQALSSAIAYLTRESLVSQTEDPFNEPASVGRTFWDVFSSLPRIAIPIGLVVLFVAVLGSAHVNTKPGDTVKAFGIPLYTKKSIDQVDPR